MTDEIAALVAKHWEHMPRQARERWLRRTSQRPIDGPDGPLTDEDGNPIDEDGRRIWKREQMTAADAAYCRWKRGKGPELTPEQRDQWRAYKRYWDRRRIERRGATPLRRGKNGRRPAETIEIAQNMCGQGYGLTQVAEHLGIKRGSLRDMLIRWGYGDLRNRLGANDE